MWYFWTFTFSNNSRNSDSTLYLIIFFSIWFRCLKTFLCQNLPFPHGIERKRGDTFMVENSHCLKSIQVQESCQSELHSWSLLPRFVQTVSHLGRHSLSVCCPSPLNTLSFYLCCFLLLAFSLVCYAVRWTHFNVTHEIL